MQEETNTSPYFQSSFDMLIDIRSMLKTNQIVSASIMSELRNTNIEDEKQKIFKLNSEFESAIRSDLQKKEG